MANLKKSGLLDVFDKKIWQRGTKDFKTAIKELMRTRRRKKEDKEFFKKITPKQIKESKWNYLDYLAGKKPKAVV